MLVIDKPELVASEAVRTATIGVLRGWKCVAGCGGVGVGASQAGLEPIVEFVFGD